MCPNQQMFFVGTYLQIVFLKKKIKVEYEHLLINQISREFHNHFSLMISHIHKSLFYLLLLLLTSFTITNYDEHTDDYKKINCINFQCNLYLLNIKCAHYFMAKIKSDKHKNICCRKSWPNCSTWNTVLGTSADLRKTQICHS